MEVTEMFTVAGREVWQPQVTVNANESLPEKFASGV